MPFRPALAWTCEECGRDNFQVMIAVENPETRARLESLRAVEPAACDMLRIPRVVVCKHCNVEHELDLPTGPIDLNSSE